MTIRKTEVILAKRAGFCMGVALALRKLDQAVAEKDRTGRIFTHGPIIHNPQVLARFERRGVYQLGPETVLKKGDTVVLRAHGIPLTEELAMRNKGVRIVDATCPKVKKAQVLIAEQTAAGRRLLLYGEPEHPEVKGLVSYAGEHFLVFDSPTGLRDLLLDAGPLGQSFLAAQTTQDRAAFVEVRRIVCDVCGHETPVLDTICDATKERQEEVRRIAGQVDFMVVVGGRNSGNTRRLTDVARSCSVPCIHIETASELDAAVPVQCRTIGLAAGASTPADIIRDVHQTLLSR